MSYSYNTNYEMDIFFYSIFPLFDPFIDGKSSLCSTYLRTNGLLRKGIPRRTC